MKTALRNTILRSAVAIPAMAWMLSIHCSAQSTAPAASPGGLDAMVKENEPKLLDELQADGLNSLLLREFDVNNTPKEQRDGILSLAALRQLLDPKLTFTQSKRLELAGQAARGLKAAMPSLPKDAARLQKYAETLVTDGTTYYVTTLEYWGENPVTQDKLKPIAETTGDLYQKASDAAEDQSGKAAQANNLQLAQQLDELSQTLMYYKEILEYNRALATDASTTEGKAARKAIVDDATDKLQQYDNPTSGVQPVVELTTAKMKILTGDATGATKLFDQVISDKTVLPVPTPFQLQDAHYFKTVAAITGKDAAGAKAAMADLITFQKTLPDLLAQAKVTPADVAATMKALDADNQLLQYRIDSLDAELAQSPTDKAKANDDGAAVLVALAKAHPELQGLIYEQLVNRLPPDKPVSTMDPLLLQAVMNKGAGEYHRPVAQRDLKVIQRGVDAAKEVLTRKDQTGISPEFSTDAAKLAPALEEALGNHIDAINGYLDFADMNKTTQTADADRMLQGAGGLVFQLEKANPDAAGLGEANERFLKLATAPPFNYTEFTYEYAKLLQGQNNFAAAAAQFKRVPSNDPKYVNARYNLMLVDKALVDTPTSNQIAHKAMVDELYEVAKENKERYASATDKSGQLRGAYATIYTAQLAVNDQGDPKAALAALEGYEKAMSTLDQDAQGYFLGKGTFVRFTAHMALHQTDAAVADLVSLLKIEPGAQGISLVHDLLLDLDKQFDKAKAADNKPTMRDIARNQAKLSGFLSDWADKNKDPQIHKAYYAYALYDAKVKRVAGTLEDDPAAAQVELKAAQAQYDFLGSKAGHDLYVAQLNPKTGANPDEPDPQVQFGNALTQYELHDYVNAQKMLSFLLVNKKLGGTTSDSNWEATLKLYDCNYQLFLQKDAVAVQNIDQTKRGLKAAYIIGGIPPKWRSQFDELREKMIPEWTPPPDADAPTTQQSASSK